MLQSKVQRSISLYQSSSATREEIPSGFSVACAHQVGTFFGLGALYVLGHRQVDELVLGLCLHHARPLLSHHLDVFWNVNITVQT